MRSLKYRKLILLSLLWGGFPVRAQDRWEKIPIDTPGGHFRMLRAMGLQTSATIGEETKAAFVMLYGRKGSDSLIMDIQIGKDDTILSNPLFDAYRGPDLSRLALQSTPVHIYLKHDGGMHRFDSKMVIESIDWVPGEYKGKAEEAFSTNIDKSTQKKWRDFLTMAKLDGQRGEIVIQDDRRQIKIILNIDFNNFNNLFDELNKFVN